METRRCILELVGIFLTLVGCVCSLVTTVLPQWLTFSTVLVPAELYILGLWETCVVSAGGTECKAYDSLLNLPVDIRVARILMCTSMITGLLGFLVSVPGLTCVKCLGNSNVKKYMKILGGVLFFLAGVTTLIPISYMAYITVVKFWDTAVPDIVPRWEFGEAMFCGWLGGFLHLPGSICLIASQYCFKMPALQRRNGPWCKIEYV
ncbi:putative claudin-24 [Latimeria chalumnae]|uniref:putative claudin-24 n=1 Tax=Latimeria chalumnae TaxID=7897 RepID=UPI0003C1930D|nr:PREDICTED: putative claudin-24 [Latimeria chalumnae]|eukprot:XP_006013854.1 PREDICTED: putative claudin-24 [Latimeria chalumnae]